MLLGLTDEADELVLLGLAEDVFGLERVAQVR
jgi:hypothetical protein